MSDYEAIRTEAPPALEDFPSIEDTGAVIRQVNRLFDPYVFFERHKDSIELWCSCCLRHGEIDIPPRTVTTVEYELLYNKHNEHVSCPYCGARATYKNARKLGKKTRLPQYLPARFVIHTPGPVWHGGNNGEADKLRSCYRNCLVLASDNGCKTVDFPSISTGVYHFPLEKASEIAIKTISEYLFEHPEIERVRMVCFDERTKGFYEKALEKLK